MPGPEHRWTEYDQTADAEMKVLMKAPRLGVIRLFHAGLRNILHRAVGRGSRERYRGTNRRRRVGWESEESHPAMASYPAMGRGSEQSCSATADGQRVYGGSALGEEGLERGCCSAPAWALISDSSGRHRRGARAAAVPPVRRARLLQFRDPATRNRRLGLCGPGNLKAAAQDGWPDYPGPPSPSRLFRVGGALF